MARYFYVWIPAIALAAVLIFIVPFLGLIAFASFVVGAVAALAALAWRIVEAFEDFVRLRLRHRRAPSGAAHRAGAAPAMPGGPGHAQDGRTA